MKRLESISVGWLVGIIFQNHADLWKFLSLFGREISRGTRRARKMGFPRIRWRFFSTILYNVALAETL